MGKALSGAEIVGGLMVAIVGIAVVAYCDTRDDGPSRRAHTAAAVAEKPKAPPTEAERRADAARVEFKGELEDMFRALGKHAYVFVQEGESGTDLYLSSDICASQSDWFRRFVNRTKDRLRALAFAKVWCDGGGLDISWYDLTK